MEGGEPDRLGQVPHLRLMRLPKQLLLLALVVLASIAMVVTVNLLNGGTRESAAAEVQRVGTVESVDGSDGRASELAPPAASGPGPDRSGAEAPADAESGEIEGDGSPPAPQFDWQIGDRLFSELDLESMDYDQLRDVVDVLRDEQYRVNHAFMKTQPWEHYWIPIDGWAPQEPDLKIDPDIYLRGRKTEAVGGELGMVFVPRGLAPEMYALKDAILEVRNTSAYRAQREIEFAEFRKRQRENFPDRELVFEMVPNGVAFRVYEGRIGGPLLNQQTFNIDNSGAR